MADFVSEDEVLRRCTSFVTYPVTYPTFIQEKHDEIEVLPRALGYGASEIVQDVNAAKHAYCGLDLYLEYPVVIKKQEGIPEGEEIEPNDDLGSNSGVVHFALRRQGGDRMPGEIMGHECVHHWSVCVIGAVTRAKVMFDQTPTSQDTFIEQRDVWLEQLRRGKPWQPLDRLSHAFSRPSQNIQPAPIATGELGGKLPMFKEYKATRKLLRLIGGFLTAHPRDILTPGQVLFAIFVRHFLEHHFREAHQDIETGYLPISPPPLAQFIIYFIEFLKRTEIHRLAYYTHPYRFVAKAYQHDLRRDSKYWISPTSISEIEVEEEMRQINPIAVDYFLPCDIMSSLIPPFLPHMSDGNRRTLNATQTLIGPIDKWIWHDCDNQAAKVFTHHLLFPQKLCNGKRIVKGEFAAGEAVHPYRMRRILDDGIFVYTLSLPKLNPALDSALEQRSMKHVAALISQSTTNNAPLFSPEQAVRAVMQAVWPEPEPATILKNPATVESMTYRELRTYAKVLLSRVILLDNAVLILAGYVVDPDKLSPQQIIRKDGEWIIDGLVADKPRPLDYTEAKELRMAIHSLYESTKVPDILGVSLDTCAARAMEDDKWRFTLKILMELSHPITSYTLYVVLVLRVLKERIGDKEEQQSESADALHLYYNLLALQQVKRDLANDPPKPYCQIITTAAMQYRPETARSFEGLEEALNSMMGDYVHESLKDCFWKGQGGRCD